MDRKVLDFLRDTLTPDQSELLSIAERLVDCCDDDPTIPADSIQFLNMLCSHFPMLVKRGSIPPVSDLPTDPAPTKEDVDRILLNSYLPPGESEEEKQQQQEFIARANRRKAYMLNVKSCLEKQLVEMAAEKANLELQKQRAKDRNDKARAVLAVQIEKFNEAASSVMELVREFNTRMNPDNNTPPLFVCQEPLDDFFEAQKEYTDEMNNFCKNAFSKDLSELSQLSPEEAATLLSGGKMEEMVNIDPKTLQLLSMKCLALMKKMRLELELSKMESIKESLDGWREKVDKLKEEGEEEAIEGITVATHEEMVERENKFFEDSKAIPKQVEEIAMDDIAEIFEGEMQKKLEKQKEMIEKLEELSDFVKHQNTMYSVVAHVYEAERRKMEELFNSLQNLKETFDETSKTVRLLEEHSKEASESEIGITEEKPRLIIPSSDRSLNRLYKLMKLENKSRFPTYEVLTEAIKHLQKKMSIAEQHAEYIQKSNLALALQTERQLDTATDTMKEFETQTEELVNGPEGRRRLEGQLQEFERKMKEVLHRVNAHKQELIQHPTLALERRMAAVYHTDPKLYEELKLKLETIKQNI